MKRFFKATLLTFIFSYLVFGMPFAFAQVTTNPDGTITNDGTTNNNLNDNISPDNNTNNGTTNNNLNDGTTNNNLNDGTTTNDDLNNGTTNDDLNNNTNDDDLLDNNENDVADTDDNDFGENLLYGFGGLILGALLTYFLVRDKDDVRVVK